jgi:ABC-type transport system involved in multi-copper enzyme maturation permease subunit
LKQRKALLLLFLPAFVVTVIMCFAVWVKFRAEVMVESRGEEMDFQAQIMQGMVKAQAEQLFGVVTMILFFAQGMGGFALLAVSWFASGLFCEDRKAGAHQLYFARPITRLDYFLGKFLTASFFSVCAMLVPLLSVCIAAAIFSPEWSFLKKEWGVIPRVIGFSLLWTVVVSSLVLMASSLASRKSFALLAIFGLVMLSVPFAAILGEFVDKKLFALALFVDLNVLAHHFLGRPGEIDGVTSGSAWVAVLALLALSWMIIAWRLRRLEVVA